MGQAKISPQEVRVYLAFRNHPNEWLTNLDVAGLVKNVARRTVRFHTCRFAELGLLEQAHMFPGTLYRLASNPSTEARDLRSKLNAAEIIVEAERSRATRKKAESEKETGDPVAVKTRRPATVMLRLDQATSDDIAQMLVEHCPVSRAETIGRAILREVKRQKPTYAG